MTHLFELATTIKTTLDKRGLNRYRLELRDGYSLSCLTGSHEYSHEFKTVEVALMKNGDWAIESKHSNDSIIHYMPWTLFLDFIGDMNSIKNGRLNKTFEEVFQQYQDWLAYDY
jgi:hypothetical protein